MERATSTLIFDDGSSAAARIPERARGVSSSVALVHVAGSPNRAQMEAELVSWGVPFTVHELRPRQGIRHALDQCAVSGALVAFVPEPSEHPGVFIRKCVQSVARAPHVQLPVLAVHVVRNAALAPGAVLVASAPSQDDGFAHLLATALAATTGAPIQRIVVGDPVVGDPVVVRHGSALAEASDVITRGVVTALPELRVGDVHVGEFIDRMARARAVVVGFGGFDVSGHKWTSPDELPDSVLETVEGHLVHAIVREAPCDVVIVIDAVRLRHSAAATVALGLVATALVAGTVLTGPGSAAAAPRGTSVTSTQVAQAPATVAGDRLIVQVTGPATIVVSNPTVVQLEIVVHLTGQHGNGSTYDAGVRHLGSLPAGQTRSFSFAEFSHDRGHHLFAGGFTVQDPSQRVLLSVSANVGGPQSIVAPPELLPPVTSSVTNPPPLHAPIVDIVLPTLVPTADAVVVPPILVPPDPVAKGGGEQVPVVTPNVVTPVVSPILVPPDPVAKGGGEQVPVVTPNVVTPVVTPILVPPDPVAKGGGEQVPVVTPNVVMPVVTPILVPPLTVTPQTTTTETVVAVVGTSIPADVHTVIATPNVILDSGTTESTVKPVTPTSTLGSGVGDGTQLPHTGAGGTVGLAALGAALLAAGSGLTLAARRRDGDAEDGTSAAD